MKAESNGDKKTAASMTKGQNGNSQKGGESSSDGHGGGKNSIDNFNGPPIPPEVDDNVATGTIKILQSPHISEGPGRIANAPVPSVYRDDRGEIHRLRVGGKRVNMLFSKQKVMRSGYLHPEPIYDFVISGKVELWVLTPKGTDKRVFGPMESFTVPAYVPHILHFLEDTILTEWWESSEALRCFVYHPYRRIIDVQNSLVSSSTGHHQLLVPQDDDQFSKFLELQSSSGLGSFLWWGTGLAMGVAIGSFIATSKRR